MVQGSPASPRRRGRMVIAGALLAAATLVGVAAWSLGPRATTVAAVSGPRLSIDVVAPVEPVPVAGGVLEVGTLNDGFDRAALDRQAEITSADYMPPDAYVGDDWAPPETVIDPRYALHQTAPAGVATVTTTDPLQDGSRLFGFDRRPVPTAPEPSSAHNATIQSELAKNMDTFFE